MVVITMIVIVTCSSVFLFRRPSARFLHQSLFDLSFPGRRVDGLCSAEYCARGRHLPGLLQRLAARLQL
jgi:hypothetical protein